MAIENYQDVQIDMSIVGYERSLTEMYKQG